MSGEILLNIQEIQTYLYGGYKDAVKTSTEWLSELSLKFIKFFKILQNFLSKTRTEDDENKFASNQSFLLCARQITLCIKYLEKTTRIEAVNNRSLLTSRSFFFDRIIWCLGRLRNTIKNTLCSDEQLSFMDLLDSILDSLCDFINTDQHNGSNLAERRATLMMESNRIEDTVKELLSMVMTFSNISLKNDKVPLTILSQNLFDIAKDFRNQYSLSDANEKCTSVSNLNAMKLESALYKLENYVNDALLRLVYQTFNDVNSDPFEKLEAATDSMSQKQAVEQFDLLIERFLLIGQFAISFCKDDIKVLSVIRSCLASIETLDTYLIPAIVSQTNDPSIEVLKLHFFEESLELQTHIHFIIDTKAFCESLVDQLIQMEDRNKKCFDRKQLFLMLAHAKILHTHFNINSSNLKLVQDKVLKFYFNDFKLILAECEAILNYPEPIEEFERRTLKRFNILKNTIKKIITAIKIQCNDFNNAEDGRKIEKMALLENAQLSKGSDYFNTIRPSALGSILYESKRSKKGMHKNVAPSPTKTSLKNMKRNESLRMTMFKKNNPIDILQANLEEPETINETDLHITEILDQLSSLSIHVGRK